MSVYKPFLYSTNLQIEPGLYVATSRQNLKTSKDEISALLLGASTISTSNRHLQQYPAITTDHEGRIMAFSAGSPSLTATRIDSPIVAVLAATTKMMDVADLCGGNITLHTLCHGDSAFPPHGGDIYNFGCNVVLTETQYLSETEVISAASKDYYSHALGKRQIKFVRISAPERATAILDLSTLSYQPTCFSEKNSARQFDVYDKWIGQIISNLDDKNLVAPLMEDLHQLALYNVRTGGGPFAAAVLSAEGEIIGMGTNQVVELKDASSHGERVALRDAISRKGIDALKGSTLVTSSSTCIACAEASARAGIKTIYFGNSRASVESSSTFTEGPLNPNFFSFWGISTVQCAVNQDTESMPFRVYMEMQQSNEPNSYLTDFSKVEI